MGSRRRARRRRHRAPPAHPARRHRRARRPAPATLGRERLPALLLPGPASPELLERLVNVDHSDRMALVADSLPQVAELDCNPVIVSPSGALAVDVKIRLQPAPPPGSRCARCVRSEAPTAALPVGPASGHSARP
ncbi:MAG: acetate--CoA ligase family protein [Acidimicrobiia bacterium]